MLCALSSIASSALDRWACLCDSASPVSPPPRTGHTATYSQGKLVVYGGRDAAGELLRSVWVFDTCANLRGPAPSTRCVLTLLTARSGHCLARSRVARRSATASADWPFGRADADFSFAAVDSRCVAPQQARVLFERAKASRAAAVFGGASGTVVLDDVWQLSLAFDPAFQNVTGNWTVMRASDSVALSSDAPRVQRRFLWLLPLLLAL